jgi:hypothetical protein
MSGVDLLALLLPKLSQLTNCGILLGFFFMTLGFGLFINLSLDSPLSKIIIYQLVAGMGIGPNFAAPLIALQSSLPPRDIAAATATFGFTRTLSNTISIVVGGVIFQNDLAHRGLNGIGPGGVFASIGSIRSDGVRKMYGMALQRMWVLYVCTSAVGLVAALFIRSKKLSKEHKETDTGLQKEILVEMELPVREELTIE